MKLKLTVILKDGRELSGVYHYLLALYRLDCAAKESNFADFRMEAV